MGTRQDYYAPFAEYLCSRGILLATFDYRDAGFSRPANLAESTATLHEWHANLDHALDAVAQRQTRRDSFAATVGGQLLGVIRIASMWTR